MARFNSTPRLSVRQLREELPIQVRDIWIAFKTWHNSAKNLPNTFAVQTAPTPVFVRDVTMIVNDPVLTTLTY